LPTVLSLAQHFGFEFGPFQGTLHCAFKSVATMLVVVCRSHSAWRQTSSPSLVKARHLGEQRARLVADV
jgi:hypothetical protein